MTRVSRKVVMFGLAAAWAASPARADFYVAPNGNDQWSGTLAEPNAQRSDGPFASLERARPPARSSTRPIPARSPSSAAAK